MPSLYCVDTSSFIHLKHFPPDVFASVWLTLEELIQNGRLFSPHEVLRELQRGDDDIHKWAKKQTALFVDLDGDQATMLNQLLAAFPALGDAMKTGPHADPIVVALALVRAQADQSPGCHVITEEALRGAGSLKIPNICKTYNLPCTNLVGLFRLEGRKF